MSYTQTQIDTLKAAAAKGVTTVTSDGNTVTYASLAEMRRQIAVMEQEIAAQSVTRPKSYVYPQYGKGV